MKNVVPSQQVTHLWANAIEQPWARNAGNSISFKRFEDFKIGKHKLIVYALFSYATCIAFRYRSPFTNEMVCVFGEASYSNTTSKHQCYARQSSNHIDSITIPAAPGGSGYQWITDALNYKAAIEYYKKELKGFTKLAKTGKTILNRENAASSFRATYNVAKNVIRVLFNKEWSFTFDMDLINDLANACAERQRVRTLKAENKRAEERAKWLAGEPERERLRLEREETAKLEFADKIEAWKDGKSVYLGSPWTRDIPIMLRLKPSDKSIVETSHGAEVSLKLALAFYTRLMSGDARQGQHVGAFEFEGVNSGIVKIGCHDIPLSEMKRLYEVIASTVSPLALENVTQAGEADYTRNNA